VVCWLDGSRGFCCHQRPALCQVRSIERQLQKALLPLLRLLLLLLLLLLVVVVRLITRHGLQTA
jgi:hypothetical protein